MYTCMYACMYVCVYVYIDLLHTEFKGTQSRNLYTSLSGKSAMNMVK